jgi:hypothetical protein
MIRQSRKIQTTLTVRFDISYNAKKTMMAFDVVFVTLLESDLPLLLLKLT